MSDNLHIGKILRPGHERDAIHIAVAPVVASETLEPGDHIGFLGNCTQTVAGEGRARKLIGIVDPFLEEKVVPGERFWMFLYPYTITSLRHSWTHPDFNIAQPAAPGSPSELWLRNFAEEMRLSYGEMMAGVDEFFASDQKECICLNFDTPSIVYEKGEQFWAHWEAVTGRVGPTEDRTWAPFRCAC